MVWYSEFNSVFFITVVSILTGSLALAFKYCLKSKCENFSCCFGLLNINRRVDLEVQQDIEMNNLNTTSESELRI
jgi:hypothetical protein